MQRHVDIVGLGRMGRAFAVSLRRAGWKVRAWSPTPRGRLVEGISLTEGPRPEDFPSAPLVLLAVSDRSIGDAAVALPLRPGQLVVHHSGALGLEVLAPAEAQGAEVGSLHPLVAVASGAEGLPPCHAAVDGSESVRPRLESLAREVGLQPFTIPPEKRALYHATASLAANGLVALASLATRLLRELGLADAQAVSALAPLLASALEGLERRGLPGGLTGPVARGDEATVRRHLEALAGREALPTYLHLSEEMLRLARELGEAAPEKLAAIEALLRDQPR